MRLDDAITRLTRFSPPAVPELRYIETAVQKVHERWPEVDVEEDRREQEELAIRLRDRVASGCWDDARTSFVTAAAGAVFSPELRDRPDLAPARDFLLDQLRVSSNGTFLSDMLKVYLESYVANTAHTRLIASAIDAARAQLSPSIRGLLLEVPELLDVVDGPPRLAARMTQMADPFVELIRSGLRNPHGRGFMGEAHVALCEILTPELITRPRIDWFINWIRPPSGKLLTKGAERAIEALTSPWLNAAPSDFLRSHLVEALIEMYGDPRPLFSGVWAGIGAKHRVVIERWLTREDMRFFTGVVDAAQKNAMWPPRRNFWLQLFDEGKIDAAWVAFSSQAFTYARQNMMREDARNADSRFGFQAARPSTNTSLLIMRIGDKIMVDGCHSYRTHVFHKDDPMAPKLFQEGYDCEEIMRASDNRRNSASRAHGSPSNGSIETWKRWVRDMINADVEYSRQTSAYTKVYRPRSSQPRYSPPQRPYAASPPRRDPPIQPQFDLGARASASTAAPPAGAPGLAPRASGTYTSSPPSTPTASIAAGRPQSAPSAPTSPTPQLATAERTGSRTLTDRMISHGPRAAAAVRDYLRARGDRAGPVRLSPKSEEALEWVRAGRGELPLRLRNALEYLLIGLKTTGVDMEELFASAGKSDVPKPGPDANQARIRAETSVSGRGRPNAFPPLPETAQERLKLLRARADALEDFGMRQATFEERRAIAIAIQKPRENNIALRPAEIGELQQLYERIRQHNARGRI
jgi:hypothetical protein